MAPNPKRIVRTKVPRYLPDVGPVEVEVEDGYIVQAWPVDGTMGVYAWKAGLGNVQIESAIPNDNAENLST